jgi:large conductance mechanosensitive channel
MQGIFREFKQFLMRGNVIDLAVAVVMGAAFGAVINSLVNDMIMPVIAMIFGKPDFSNLTFTINNAVFRYGAFITALITFVLTAAAIFFFVVKPINMLMNRARREPPADPTTMKCPFCLSEVPIGATRCAFCTSELAAAA